MQAGTLFLIPVPLGNVSIESSLPADALATIRPIRHFVVENAKSARVVLKAIATETPLQALELKELSEHTPFAELDALLAPLRAGHHLGLLSEAGCPAIADPGANLVAKAQAENIRVVPLIGPSSIILALMGSGMNGQRFAFHGYLPVKEAARTQEIRSLELESRKRNQTQLFIETPYRNLALFDALLKVCQPDTRLCLATSLSLPDEAITTKTIRQWRQSKPPELDRRPTVFLMLA